MHVFRFDPKVQTAVFSSTEAKSLPCEGVSRLRQAPRSQDNSKPVSLRPMHARRRSQENSLRLTGFENAEPAADERRLHEGMITSRRNDGLRLTGFEAPQNSKPVSLRPMHARQAMHVEGGLRQDTTQTRRRRYMPVSLRRGATRQEAPPSVSRVWGGCRGSPLFRDTHTQGEREAVEAARSDT
jgi:hypothetical protein